MDRITFLNESLLNDVNSILYTLLAIGTLLYATYRAYKKTTFFDTKNLKRVLDRERDRQNEVLLDDESE